MIKVQRQQIDWFGWVNKVYICLDYGICSAQLSTSYVKFVDICLFISLYRVFLLVKCVFFFTHSLFACFWSIVIHSTKIVKILYLADRAHTHTHIKHHTRNVFASSVPIQMFKRTLCGSSCWKRHTSVIALFYQWQ